MPRPKIKVRRSNHKLVKNKVCEGKGFTFNGKDSFISRNKLSANDRQTIAARDVGTRPISEGNCKV